MKTVYFVRHGESDSNLDHISRGAASVLTERGQDQARRLAERFSQTAFDVIISSHYRRAVQTAEIISQHTKLPHIICEDFHEVRFPSVNQGRHSESPEALATNAEVMAHFGELDWRHSDEETYFEQLERAKRALGFLEERPEATMLVVSHGTYLRFLMASMMFKDELTAKEAIRVWKFLKTSNTGVTVCTHAPEDGWRLLTWNDHAHLAE